MRSIDVQRDVAAPRGAVWAVLADFPGISNWNTGVKTSFSTSDSVEGVGATRHCDLAPMGELEETVAEWEPESRLVIRIDSASKLPIRSGLVTFELDGEDDTTATSVTYRYTPKGGPFAFLIGPILDKQLTRGFEGFLADLESAAQATVA